jgi:hypothetical protein
MATVSGLGTTFNLPNYHGDLIAITPTDTPLLSLSGGIGGGKQIVDSTTVEWQTEDLRDPEIRARLEGADAPESEERSRANVDNQIQIFHETVKTSYTKQATSGQYSTATAAPFISSAGGPNPVADEHGHQVANALKTIARDVNYAFWYGKEVKPTTNSTARQTAGLLSVITTNRVATGEITGASAATDTITVTHAYANGDKVVFTDVGASTAIRTDRVYYVVNVSTTVSFKVSATLGGAAITIGTATVSVIKAGTTLTVDGIGSLMQSVFESGGISEQETAALFCSPRQKRALTATYAAEYGKSDPYAGTRNIAGLNVQTIETDFGTLNVVTERALAPDTLAVVSLEQIDPVFLNIPGKGVLFEEELAKTGSSIKSQIYGEIGLKYGNQLAHGVIRGLAV